jgi:hypothetical protein
MALYFNLYIIIKIGFQNSEFYFNENSFENNNQIITFENGKVSKITYALPPISIV